MKLSSLPVSVREHLEKPQHAVIAYLRQDGRPMSVATWYLLEGDHVMVNMAAGRHRVRDLRRDPRVSLTVLDAADWYRHVSLQGTVVGWRDDPTLQDIDAVSVHYTGRAYPDRESARLTALVEIDDWHTWGAFPR